MLSAFVFQEQFEKDPTWELAFDIATKTVPVPDHVGQLLRSAWNGFSTPSEMTRVLGFCHLNPLCLFNAAGHNDAIPSHSKEKLEQAIQFLGVRFCSVVLAVNFVGRNILSRKPPASWVKLFEDGMSSIEIGYVFGQRCADLGCPGGSIAAYARHIGLQCLMVARPKLYVKYLMFLKGNGELSSADYIDIFGCEPWQVSALVLQQLGFGSDLAFGCALASSTSDLQRTEISDSQLRWKAASLWIESLKRGRNYPAEKRFRTAFAELTPPEKPGQRNQNLETLYIEVAKLRGRAPKWTWHLPKRSYEATKESL
jgi:hypothetical protein